DCQWSVAGCQLSVKAGCRCLLLTTNNWQLTTSSERDVIFLELLFLAVGLLGGRALGGAARGAGRGRLRRAGGGAVRGAREWRTATGIRLVGATAAWGAAAWRAAVATPEELEVIDDHRVLAALAAALLVFPGVVLQPSLDQQGSALSAVLVDDL